MMSIKSRFFSKKGLKSLFLLCVFPIHFWSILIFFLNNFPERVNLGAWDSIGLLAYHNILSFFEALLFFLILIVLGLLVPKHWSEDKKILFFGNLAWITWFGLILAQYMDSAPMKRGRMWFIVGSISIVMMVFFEYASLNNEDIGAFHLDLFERVQVLSYFFLMLDLISVFVILLRNIFWIRF